MRNWTNCWSVIMKFQQHIQMSLTPSKTHSMQIASWNGSENDLHIIHCFPNPWKPLQHLIREEDKTGETSLHFFQRLHLHFFLVKEGHLYMMFFSYFNNLYKQLRELDHSDCSSKYYLWLSLGFLNYLIISCPVSCPNNFKVLLFTECLAYKTWGATLFFHFHCLLYVQSVHRGAF